MSKIYVLVICIVQCLNKDKKVMFLPSPSQTQVKELKKKKSNSVALATDSFSVILLASGLATAFLSLDEII